MQTEIKKSRSHTLTLLSDLLVPHHSHPSFSSSASLPSWLGLRRLFPLPVVGMAGPQVPVRTAQDFQLP